MWVEFSDKLGMGCDSRKVGFQVDVVCFFFWPFITCPFKSTHFPGMNDPGAQVRSGEFELPAGHQVDTGGVGCVSRRSGLG